MVLCNLRSLLVAVIVLSNCIAWTASRHHYTHNVSGHRSRHRRQGKGLYLSSSYVIPGGEGTGWGDWGDSTPCSRTCGGGVASQKRICLKFGPDGQPQCTGGDTKYFSCETQDCPPGSGDFRAEQCSKYDDVEYRNIKYKWKPYTRGPNPCELNCMPHGERFYYRHQLKVIDGTRCNDDSFDVCVNGTCQPVGCDMMLGSNAREDKCRRCRGNGKNCYTTNGVLDTQDLIKGYNDMLLIPEGATTIVIMEVKPSNNYLALRAKNGTYYLNGDYHIDFPRSMTIAGALWFYERSQQGFAAPDKLRCLGPTTEPLYLSLLLQSVNVGIEYEYSLPTERAPRPTQNYTWVHEHFSECSATCGGGFQTRNVTCRTQMDLELVDDALCDEGLKPVTNQTCNNNVCPPQWVTGEWGSCSHRCGPDGTQSREIQCEKIIVNGFRSIVSDKECFDLLGPKPEKFRKCNVNTTCPTWFTGPWKPCDTLYGEGKQTRQVVCYQKNGRRIDVLDDSECTDERPESEQKCMIHSEERTDWVASEWSGCDNCFSTMRTRIAKCTTYDRKLVDDSFCAHHPLPILQEPCDAATLPACDVQWYATQWSKCSSECGDGTQTRRVFCGIYVNNTVVEVEESKCAGLTKYSEKRNCTVPKEKCPSLWYTAPWSKCSKECGGGEQSRRVLCLRGDQFVSDCSGLNVPDSVQVCNTGPCNKDEIITLDSHSTPIMDEEDCDYEEYYPEIGLDFALAFSGRTSPDLMLSDTPSADIDSGTETGSIDTDYITVSDDFGISDDGSGSGFSSFSTDFTSDTTDDYSTDSTDSTVTESSVSPSSVSDLKHTPRSENGTVEPKAAIATKDTTTSETETSVTDLDYSTIEDTDYTVTDSSTSSDETTGTDDESSTTTDFSSSDSTITETYESGSTDSSTLKEISETATDTPGLSATSGDEISASDKSKSTDISETTEKLDSTSYSATTESSTDESTVEFESSLYTEDTSASTSSELSSRDITDESSTPYTKDTEGITASGSTESTFTDETTMSKVTEESSVAEEETTKTTITEEVSGTSESASVVSDKTTMTTLSEDTGKTSVSEEITTEMTVTEETSETSPTEGTSDKTTMTTVSEETEASSVTEETTTETTVAENATDISSTEVTASDKTTMTTMSEETEKTTEEATTEITVTKEVTESSSTETATSDKTISTLSEETGKTSVAEESTTEKVTEATVTTMPEETGKTITSEEITIKTTVTEEPTDVGSSEAITSDKTTVSTASEETGKSSVSEEETVKTTVAEASTEPSSTEAITSDKTKMSTISEETGKTSVSEEITVKTTVIEESTEPSSTEAITSEKTSVISTSEETGKTSVSEEVTVKTTVTDEATEITSTVSIETKETSVSGSTEELSTQASSKIESPTTESGITSHTTYEESTVSTTEKGEVTSETTELTKSVVSTETMLSTTEKEETIMSTTELIWTEESSSTTESTEETGSTTEISSEYTESTPASQIIEASTTVAPETNETGTPASALPVEGFSTSTEGITTQESEVTVITTEKSKPGTTLRSPWSTPTHRRRCKPRKRTCSKTMFGCCPDRKTPAKGPYDEGCPRPKTCHESKFGCCHDGLSPALGPFEEGCPTISCTDTLFGCCLSDNTTAAEGNDQEGCPPPPPACKSTVFGCCADDETEARGPDKEGCPELTTSTELPSTTESEAQTEPESTSSSEATTTNIFSSSIAYENCTTSEFGCCFDQETPATGPQGEGCPCNSTEFGCCPDGVSPARGNDFEGCVITCNLSSYGCCPDGETPAHGPDGLGCCLLSAYGCCPDNRKPAVGPHLEGCGCQYSSFGCCPDNATVARGPNFQGCGCQYTEHGCCPDRHTEAAGPDYDGCGCHTYQFGCCPDGVTIAKGQNHQGCDCRDSQYGCCGDGKTPATGPEREGCDCATSEYGCCPDGLSEAKGHKFYGCSDLPENKQAACGLPHDRGTCRNYSVYWYYDLEYGGCSRFWYGGCEGNGNKFATKEECEDVCVQPAPKDACNLPKVKGACLGYNIRWYYDAEQEQCSQFIYGGCLGNANNYASLQLCQEQCQPERSEDQCRLPIDRGSCSGNFGRWGFNSETRRCEQFIWGGCEGNTNRFSSEIACIQRCDPPGKPKPQCMENQDVGNCTEKQPAWFFSQTEDRCVPFYYTGCGGNDNRFDSEQGCAQACPSAYVPDLCTLPAAIGDCADYRERWYYDTREKSCQRFYYGGCAGNGNNFATQAECEGRCSEAKITTTVRPTEAHPLTEMCFMEKDPGPCTDTETRWVYDYKLGKCVTFEYGGCGGNRNNFPTEEYCQYYCGTAQDICQLPMRSGPCTESLMRWFYDPSSDSCSQFTYGGCDGNDNRFETRDDCESRCRTGSAQTTTTPTTSVTVAVDSRIAEQLPTECHISPSEEPCQRSGQVWYLDQRLGECVSHDNLDSSDSCRHTGVFPTQEACERTCGAFRNINVCRYDLDPGPCRTYEAKYFFDKASRSCREFAYGGCHGGPNRFSTIDECQEVCRSEMDPCKQVVEPGDCTSRYVMWYYDNVRDTCLQFIYGGCHGNENRFETLEDCERKCRQRPESVSTTTAFIATTTTTTTLAPTLPPTVAEPIAEECRTPESLVPCGANITTYYYDQESRSCVQGDIGGCRYANSFRTEEECERRCGAFRDINVCEARLDPGPCRSSIPKFYWEPASGSCLQYSYGGCGGGANRFSTIEECEEICGNTGPDVVGPDCGPYEEECLQLVCPYGISRDPTPEGCTRCACVEAPVDCAPMRVECEQMRCTYGMARTQDLNGCEKCSCLPDPCVRQRCPLGESCVAIAKRDPVTNDAQFYAVCKPVNEVLPDCDRFNDECSRLRCEYGVQRTRTVDGCERCSCVQVEIDCEPLKLECERLKCQYLVERQVGADGCERCRCSEHPCKNKECGPGDRCVPTAYLDPITQESRFSSECRPVNKTGYCPVEQASTTEYPCPNECVDDADCRGVGKCCARGCGRACAVPDAPTSAAPHTTTHAPDLPQSPQVSQETEPEVAAEEGGKATLRCIFHGNPPPKITWRRGEITIDGDRDRYRLLSDGSLEIVSVYRNDSGVYICVAENDLGTARQEIYLKVKDPVETPAGIAGEQRQEIIGVLGKRLVIRCLTYGYPTPYVSWHRGLFGSMVPYSSSLYEARDNVLLIRRLTYETVGEYTCQAYNGKGQPASWLVVVKAHQTDDEPSNNPYILPRIREPDEAIHVEVKEVTPRHVATFTTTTSTTPEPEIDSGAIFNVPVHTKLAASSSSLTAGSELVLECEVDGYPEPDVYWTKDGRRIIPNDNIRISGSSVSHLTVARVALSDAGMYECHARNNYSSHYSYLQIAVQPLTIPAKCTDSPFFANCPLIVRSKFCQHKYYSKFCCKSCLEAGQLSAHEVEMQADQPLVRK
ncbi:papilin-like isoform X4 [Manduca sexta]|uniref:papilin-like isoform X4 n=1 Tax=Manduca sexta TaxID=7130 RepID=UPI00188FF335|nr:papilin-like isoform X4 [Manduca sexta]